MPTKPHLIDRYFSKTDGNYGLLEKQKGCIGLFQTTKVSASGNVLTIVNPDRTWVLEVAKSKSSGEKVDGFFFLGLSYFFSFLSLFVHSLYFGGSCGLFLFLKANITLRTNMYARVYVNTRVLLFAV